MGEVLVLEKRVSYSPGTDYDALWKKIISELFEEFILFFAPDLYEAIDFGKGIVFLEQELHKVIIEHNKGKKIADKIVKVSLKNGEEKYVFIHIEIQGKKDPDFSRRMFTYFYRLFDRFQENIYSIAILTDLSKSNDPQAFQYSFYGTELMYRFNTYKFNEEDIPSLKKSTNPFAIAVLAGIYLHQTEKNYHKRYEVKKKLLKDFILTNPNLKSIYAEALFYFIDYLLYLPHELTKQLTKDLSINIEKEAKHMLYSEKIKEAPTLAEYFKTVREEGFEIGIEKGKMEEKRNLAAELLREGFSVEKVAKMVKLSLDEVKEIEASIHFNRPES